MAIHICHLAEKIIQLVSIEKLIMFFSCFAIRETFEAVVEPHGTLQYNGRAHFAEF
jgi:hypothetical protein